MYLSKVQPIFFFTGTQTFIGPQNAPGRPEATSGTGKLRVYGR